MKVLILLGSSSDLPVTEEGIQLLKRLGIAHSLRICSAHRTPERLHDLVREFEAQGGQVYVCVAGMSAHLAGVVASLTVKPVVAVPVARAETAGLDALFSMGQMPKGIPVSTMTLGKTGFTNAALTATQILALSDARLAQALVEERRAMARAVASDDEKHRQDFRG
jgi:phosphoribosylaminoimidazole carboxylase PurE protein